MLGESARRRRIVDHWRDDRRSAGVNQPAGQREVADRNARQGRFAGQADGEDRLGRADVIEAAVLQVERHRIETFPRQSLGDGGVVDADPGGQNVAPLGQPARQFADHPAVAHAAFLSRPALVGQPQPRVNRRRPTLPELLVT